jgi:hypothetical protein
VGLGDTIMRGASQHVDAPSAYIHPGWRLDDWQRRLWQALHTKAEVNQGRLHPWMLEE